MHLHSWNAPSYLVSSGTGRYAMLMQPWYRGRSSSDVFGPYRPIIGSDWPVCAFARYCSRLRKIADSVTDAEPAIRDLLFHRDATDAYRPRAVHS